MKRIKKLVVMMLCLVMMVALFTACKKTDDSSGGTSSSGEDATVDDATTGEEGEDSDGIDFSETVEYSWWLMATPYEYYSDYGENPVVEYLNEKFNMKLSFQQPVSGAEADSLSIMFGTGEYTDLIDIQMYSGSLSQLHEEGTIINIADYLEYMPNFSKLLEDENIRKNVYTDDGLILGLPQIYSDDTYMWGGLVYRRDILDTMTGGKVEFPSGNDEPTTIEDMEYMLDIFKNYFEAAGMAEYAPLIIPAQGMFPSELITSFGVIPGYYADANGKVKFGIAEEGFYNYLSKMKEWYEAGYIYKDFASRTNDLFLLPNTSLTYGLAAGCWFGLNSQLGGALSMPDYGVTVDIRGMKNPIDTATGITSAPNTLYTSKYDFSPMVVITSGTENVERLLATLDFMYSEEGSILKNSGLNKEQGSAENKLYADNGLEDGYYYVDEDGNIKLNEQLGTVGGPVADTDAFRGIRLPGLADVTLDNQYAAEEHIAASNAWIAYQDTTNELNKMPGSLTRTTQEEEAFGTNSSRIDDYANGMILKFILGTEDLNETSWKAFTDQLYAYGLEDNISIMQAAYDRYLAR